MLNPFDADDIRTCHDCDADLGSDPFSMMRASPIGRIPVYLCPTCAAPYLDEQGGEDDQELDIEREDRAWGIR